MIGEDPILKNFVKIPPLTEEEAREEQKPTTRTLDEENCWKKPKSHLQQMEGGDEVARFLR